MNLSRFIKVFDSFFFLTQYFRDEHRLMYKKSTTFVYIFVSNCNFFPNKSVTESFRKLKTDIFYHLDNTFQITDTFSCDFKVGLSSSKKSFIICFNDSPQKMMKNPFCFILKDLFVLKIFKFLS